MFKTLRCFLLLWIATLSLLGCQAVIPRASAPVMQTATLTNTATPFPLPSLTASPTPLPTAPLTLTSTPTPSPRFSGLLAFLGTDVYVSGLTPSRLDLFLLDGNGKLTCLTEEAAVIDFAWSPDGRKLVFSAMLKDDLDFDLYLVDVDGTRLTPIQVGLETDSVEGDATWSPDGQKIAFSQFLGGKERIYIMNADGSDVQFLVEGGDPSWSPDGRSLVFVKRVLESAEGDIYIIGADGSDLRQLTEGLFAFEPVFSPDGEMVAFVSNKGGQSSGIYVIQADGTGLTQLTNGLNRPSWFSTTQVLFAGKNTIFTIGAGGGPRETLIQLPANFYLEFVAKQPDVP